MKLQAEITNDLLARIALILKSYSKDDIILHFSEEELSFCIPNDNFVGIWVGCKTESCFNKYRIESKYGNLISMKIEASQFAQALSMEHASSIRVILSQTNKFIFLQFTHKSLDALKQLEHKVPVIILSPQNVQQYAEPGWNPATMIAKLPPIKNVSSWCSNASNISKFVTISIIKNAETNDCDVGFRVESDAHMVSVFTRFPNMAIPDVGYEETSIEDSDLMQCEVTVDLKKFNKILKVQSLQPTVALLYIYDKKSIRLHFVAGNTSMTYALTGVTQ